MSAPERWWRLKRALLRDPITLAVPLHTDLGRRPHTQVILQPGGRDGAKNALTWVLAVLVLLFLVVAVAEQLWLLALIAAGIAALGGLAAWVAHRRAAMSWSATWHRDHVVVHDGRYGRSRTWQEHLVAFTGVARAHAYIARGNELTPNLRVHGVILEHPAPEKSVLLHAQREPIGDDVLAHYARELGTRVIG